MKEHIKIITTNFKIKSNEKSKIEKYRIEKLEKCELNKKVKIFFKNIDKINLFTTEWCIM